MFDRPWMLVGLAILPILYWLERRRDRPVRLRVPSLLLWSELPERTMAAGAARTRWLRFLWIASAWSALVLSAAGPFLAGSSGKGRRVAVLLDRSAGMAARSEDGASRFDQARARAREWLGGLAAEDLVRVETVPPRETPRPFVPVSEALDDLASLVVSDLPGRPQPGDVSLAAGFQAGVEVCVFTDDPRALGDDPVAVVVVGEEAANLAIRSLVAGAPGASHVAEVRNYSKQAVRAEVEWHLQQRVAGGRELDVPALDSVTVEWPATGDGRVELRLRVGGGDALGADDAFRLSRTAGGTIRVAAVGDVDDAILRALRIDPRVRLTVGETAADHDMWIWQGVAPRLDRAGEHFVIDPDGAVGAIEIGGWIEPRTLVAASLVEMADVSLRGVVITGARALRAPAGAVALVQAVQADGTSQALIVRDGAVTVFGFAPGRTSWVRRPSFPIFWHEQLSRIGDAASSDATLTAFACGDSLRLASAGRWIDPEGGDVRLAGAGPHLVSPSRAGWYRFERDDGESRLIAVNLVSDLESECAAFPASRGLPALPPPASTAPEPWPAGRALALLGAVLLSTFYLRHGELARRR